MFKQNVLKQNLLGFFGAFLLSFACFAEDVQLAANHPDTYVVKKGDTLWDISGKFLVKPWLWPEIWHANPEIANPHLIYPGDTLKLVYVDGKPRLEVNRGAVKLTPGDGRLSPSVRVENLEEPIPAIPLDVIDPFLSGTRIVAPGVLEKAPYVLMGAQKHVVTGAGDMVNARGRFDPKVPVYGILRKGKIYSDDATGELLGIQAIDVGTVKVQRTEGELAELAIVRSTQEVIANDRLMPNEERSIQSIFYPKPPKINISGSIIDVENGVSQIGPMSVVLINRGKREGVEVGNVFAISQRGEKVKDPVTGQWVRLMDDRAGLLMVFNVFDKTSFGLVLAADRPLAVGDVVKNP